MYGMPDPSHGVVVRGDPQADSYVVFYLSGEKIRAAIGPMPRRHRRPLRSAFGEVTLSKDSMGLNHQ
jgi:hypothetical protein